MKVVVDRKVLADAAKAVSKFLPRRAVEHMAFANIMVEALPGRLRLKATDLDSGRFVDVTGKVEQGPEQVLVNPALVGILAAASGEKVSLSTSKTTLTIKDDHSTWRLRLTDPEDYPKVSEPGPDPQKVPISDWSRLQAVASMASTDNKKSPILQGVLLEDGTAVATDSYRMAFTNFTDPVHPTTLVPAQAIRSLEGDVTAIEVGTRLVRADLDDGAWWSRVIDGTFVKWRNLLHDADPQVEVEVLSDLLAEALRRATLVGDSKVPVYVRPIIGEGLEVFRLRDGETAYEETVEAKVEGDEDLKIAFSPTYLRSMVEPVESVRIELFDAFKPATFTGGEDDWWNGACMPVRV